MVKVKPAWRDFLRLINLGLVRLFRSLSKGLIPGFSLKGAGRLLFAQISQPPYLIHGLQKKSQVLSKVIIGYISYRSSNELEGDTF